MATIYLISGPIQSHKTTTLTDWSQGRTDVGGILSPVMFGKRYFHNVKSGELLPMEAEIRESAVQQVGRYTFSEAAFEWANRQLQESIQNPDLKWLIIDEIGPLELQGKGLDPALSPLLSSPPPHLNLILVIREKILESVIALYELEQHDLKIIASAEGILNGLV